MTALVFSLALLSCACLAGAQSGASRWRLDAKGGIKTDRDLLTRGASHHDHIEMGGRAVNAIIKWEVDQAGRMNLERIVRWPMLREKIDDTHASLAHTFGSSVDPIITINGKAQPTEVLDLCINGTLAWTEVGKGFRIEREIFPSSSLPSLLERWVVTNTSKAPLVIQSPLEPIVQEVSGDKMRFAPARITVRAIPGGRFRLMPGESTTIGFAFSATTSTEPDVFPDLEAELAGRKAFIASLNQNLHLETGDPVVDQLFAFSKLRAAENVLATRGGLMHAPGGFNKYLAALWCNDQNEYVSPFFPFLGDPAGNESARNAYAWYAKYVNPEFRRLPSSIVAEGRGTWQGAGDRGDAAMTAYGASRWALATGDKDLAQEVWPLIEWCLEFCERKKTADGVIASDSDELEGRFSSGKTNLATSCLTFDALVSAAFLADELGKPASVGKAFRQRAEELKSTINRFFGATIAGFETYRYHEGLESLRSWICIPLVMDIHERAPGTIQALFSPDLWTKDGLLTAAGSTTFWDRSTLYALRGVFRAGYAKEAAEHLHNFAETRLLGDHVPYCIKAYPEQNQSHLSAEAGLYCRILIEGAIGLRPTGFDSFTLRPEMPPQWKKLNLRNIQAFGRTWSVAVARRGKNLEVKVVAGQAVVYQKTLPAGAEHQIALP